ncbi:MAG: ATP-dependent Clp protease ATP-binding subunit [Bacteroidales bacterium]|nr:ATP-dependent Clp protease ATP-binding subunit [Bacteroidales bacterium]
MSNDFSIHITDELKNAIRVAQATARENYHSQFTPAHLLKGLLHKDSGIAGLLSGWGEDIYYMADWADVRIEDQPKSTKIPQLIEGNENIDNVFYEAENICVKLQKDELDPICVLAALCLPGVGFSYDQLKTFPLKGDTVIERIQEKASIAGSENNTGTVKGKQASGTAPKLLYCVDLLEGARNGKLNKVVGRDIELMSIAEIICRLSRPNVIVTGDPGVGKTSVVHSLANSIVEKLVPVQLYEARLFELNISELLAGATYKGELEDRLKNILNELRKYPKALLFIDDIHTIIDKNNGYQGVVNLLKSELSKGGFTLIGTTSRDEYRKHIDSDPNLKRRFEFLDIEEPTINDAVQMVENAMCVYALHHNIAIERAVIEDTVKLSKRYAKERCLPDSAIDLLDRTMSALRILIDTTPHQAERLITELSEINTNDHNALVTFINSTQNVFNKLVFTIKENELPAVNTETPGKPEIEAWLKRISETCKNRKAEVTIPDVATILAKSSGIPVGKLLSSEQERLLNMEDQLKAKIIGQDTAVKTITDAILESRSGLSQAGLPIGAFFLLGPTGTGKTELAKQLADFLFQDQSAMIRFDMSEFKEEHSAALLYGAPPGYVGYEEGGMLVNKIRQHPYSIVLFDEIEKAHKSVFDIFLQILDEGKLHDRLGKTGDFSNSVVLFTSNIGSDYIVNSYNQHNTLPESNDLMEIMGNYFRPEFLGRLTSIVPFAPITRETIGKIFDLQMKVLVQSLNEQGIELKINSKARDYLAEKGYTPAYGARPLRSVIRSELRTPVSRRIISGEITNGCEITVTLNPKNEIEITVEKGSDINKPKT